MFVLIVLITIVFVLFCLILRLWFVNRYDVWWPVLLVLLTEWFWVVGFVGFACAVDLTWGGCSFVLWVLACACVLGFILGHCLRVLLRCGVCMVAVFTGWFVFS